MPGIPVLIRKTDMSRVEPPGRFRLGHHQRRASLGAWSASRSQGDRKSLIAWKSRWPFDRTELARFAAALEAMVRLWSPVFPRGTVIAVPPRGASLHGLMANHPYAAGLLARTVADRLELPFLDLLRRTDDKERHCVALALGQAPFRVEVPDPAPTKVLVLDDLVTTGSTMKLSLRALRDRGIPAFGFSVSGA